MIETYFVGCTFSYSSELSVFFCILCSPDEVSELTNASIVATCSHLVACWQQQPDCQGGLYVDNFGYQLTNGTSMVEGGVVTNTCVSFNLSTTMPNVDGYMLSIWGQASPGNGPPTTLQAIAATGSLVSMHIMYVMKGVVLSWYFLCKQIPW